jgi:hypothetical protein
LSFVLLIVIIIIINALIMITINKTNDEISLKLNFMYFTLKLTLYSFLECYISYVLKMA